MVTSLYPSTTRPLHAFIPYQTTSPPPPYHTGSGTPSPGKPSSLLLLHLFSSPPPRKRKKKKGPILCSLTTPVRLSIDSGNHQTVKKKKKREETKGRQCQIFTNHKRSQSSLQFPPPIFLPTPLSSLCPCKASARSPRRVIQSHTNLHPSGPLPLWTLQVHNHITRCWT
ncbi:hypothetical protein PDE_02309 [Penicillium oxalicum 114-2]|uniref:Uncharacterized protein n=1 Tax=Penicillium oxalicum (strain 114-2 / CGMCC 5302) TaxID=933388 RepID=S7ZFF8_PENO1|nr:hypothetical protein PDE_02309 [Penicillium oxalicum 114-2]